MLNSLVTKIKQLPPLMLGFICLLGVMGFLYFNDPPKGLCDIQMESIQSQLADGFYSEERDGSYGRSVKSAKNFCLSSNSPGGCHDLFTRLSFFEKHVRTLPAECGTHEASLPLRTVIEKSVKLMVAIGWGDEPPKDKYNKTSWLDSSDLGLFCRLKYQHVRLYGKPQWVLLRNTVLPTLPEATTLPPRTQWERSLFSFPCEGLY